MKAQNNVISPNRIGCLFILQGITNRFASSIRLIGRDSLSLAPITAIVKRNAPEFTLSYCWSISYRMDIISVACMYCMEGILQYATITESVYMVEVPSCMGIESVSAPIGVAIGTCTCICI